MIEALKGVSREVHQASETNRGISQTTRENTTVNNMKWTM